MKVVLPDSSELELPDGATGRDAAAAIGPKLAEQAVLVRMNGRVQDLRLPLEDGERVEILTVRDKSDPDALAVLRHSSAHLLAEAVRRLYPGVKIAIGPPIENGFYYDFEFPEPIHEDDLQQIEDEIRRELEEGREWSREEIPREEARKRFEAEEEPYKVELVETAEDPISIYTQGDFTDLCHFSEHSPGSPIWHPKGMAIWHELEKVRYRENERRGYQEIKTPIIYDAETFWTSGHFPTYEDLMFKLDVEGRPWAIKAMNCPGAMLLFGSKLRSYRELPMRLAEPSPLHRNELSGTLHGLLRVRIITQDDAHIFCTEDQIQGEIAAVVDYARYLYGLFGMTATAELSTRPDKKIGTDEQWDMTEAALEEALRLNEIEYDIAAGEGAFYGPKIDLHMEDAIGRKWQIGTIQLDSQMPSRFGLTYVGPDNEEHPLYVVHRALYGSFERFIGILIEHYAGAFPFWLAPVQVRLIPVGQAHQEAGRGGGGRVEGYRVEVDERDETVSKRIRDAEVEKIPYVIVYGDRESEDSLAVRRRGGEQATLSLEGLRKELATL